MQANSEVAERLKTKGIMDLRKLGNIGKISNCGGEYPNVQFISHKLNFGNSSQKNTQKQISTFSFPIQFYWIFLGHSNILSGVVEKYLLD